MAVSPPDRQTVEQRIQQINDKLMSDIAIVNQELDRQMDNLKTLGNEKINSLQVIAEEDKNREIEQAKNSVLDESQEKIQEITNINTAN